jgi:hypothetical protein
MVSRKDYDKIAVDAAHSVLLELARILGEYRDSIAVVGGWVPSLVIENAKEKHIGSIDVDIAVDHRTIDEPGYRTIRQLLIGHGYTEGDQPFIFFRDVCTGGTVVQVEVDLLGGEYAGTGKGHRTQKVQDIRARKARGCELAFEIQRRITVQGSLPGGAKDSASIRVAGIVSFFAMKGMALHDRMKEKDAWDIYYCLKNYPGGMEKLVDEFRPHRSNALVKEGLRKIAAKFASMGHFGPVAVAAFQEVTDEEEKAFVQRDAYERTTAFLSALGIGSLGSGAR